MSLLIGQDGRILSPPTCPAGRTCAWHRRAEAALDAGRGVDLVGQMDLYAVLAGRAWAHCTCGLWARIQAAVPR
jgi:hypothetical protein